MGSYQKELTLIKKILMVNPRGMTVKGISDKININRNSVAKYLDILLTSGHAEMKSIGPAKVFFLSHRVPLSAMLNFSSDYIVVLDKNLRIVHVNNNLLRLMRIEREVLFGKYITDCPEKIFTSQKMISRFNNALRGKDSTEYIHFQKAKKAFHFKMKLIPTTFEGGEIGVTMILEDITEQKHVEEALRKSEEKYRFLFDKAPVGIGIANFKGEVLDANHNMEKITGYTLDELKTINIKDIYVNLNERKRLLKELQKNGEVRNFEVRLKRKSGTIYYALLNIYQMEINRQKLLLTSMTDITERKKAEGELIKAHSAIENSLDAIFTTDLKGRVTYANPAAVKMWGFENTAKMSGTRVLDYWSKSIHKKVKEIMDILRKEGSYSGSKGLIAKRKDGTEFFVAINAAMMKDKSGKPIGMTGSFTEIVRRKKADE